MQDGYGPAAVCRRGHVASSDLRLHPTEGSRCPVCGSQLLTACPACEQRIRGEYFVSGVIAISAWSPSDFCDKCGAAFPWASWQARVWALENMLDDDDLDEPTRLRVTKLLEQVAADGEDFDLDSEKKVWGRIKDLWPALLGKAWTVAAPLITAEAKQHMGLPPS